jgi:hypothetical protein
MSTGLLIGLVEAKAGIGTGNPSSSKYASRLRRERVLGTADDSMAK